ncbi:DUF4113 domain-containing protein, partial [Klebsiella pneumoniae]
LLIAAGLGVTALLALRMSRAINAPLELISQGVAQLNLFDELAPRHNSARLMQVLDQLNAKNGRGALYFAGQGIQQQWQMKREMLSPRYTTRYGDLLRVR